MTSTSSSSPTSQTLLSTSHSPPSSANVPEVTTRSTRTVPIRTPSPSEHHDRAQDLAAMHLEEGLLDVLEPDRLGDEAVERQPALQVQVDEHREVAAGQAVAVPRRLQRTAAAEEVHQRHVDPHVGCGNADEHDRAGEVARVERLLVGLRAPHGVDDDVRAEPAGEVADRLDRIGP